MTIQERMEKVAEDIEEYRFSIDLNSRDHVIVEACVRLVLAIAAKKVRDAIRPDTEPQS